MAVPLKKVKGDVRYSASFYVNGEPLSFLIDSGANSTDVDEASANRIGLVRSRTARVVTRGALGREIRSGLGRGTLRVGPMMAKNFPFTIAPNAEGPTSTSAYAGQVGLDALDATGSLVDIPSGKLWVPGRSSHRARTGTVQPLGAQPGLGQKVLKMGTAGTLPHLLLHGTLDGRHVSWVVDTGAEISVMSAEAFHRFGLPSHATNSRMIDASGDRIALRRAQLSNLRFGNVNVGTIDVAIAPLPEVRRFFRDPSGRPVDGILGMDFLTSGHILLDTSSRILYVGRP
ncbi:MAG: retropepsin-like aspartic protease [Verrucomicrobiaceae bacterium]